MAYEGRCHDGPMDGETVTIRRPKGFHLVDKVANRCWTYDAGEDGDFYCRQSMGVDCDTGASDSRFTATDESEYDVLAAPWVGT